MKKTTPNVLSKRLTQYSALTAAIAGISEGNSQNIVHVDLAPSYLIGGNDSGTPTHWLNLNSDSLNDFRFNGLSAPAVVIDASGGSNAFLGNNGTFKYALALNDLDPINSSQNTWFNASIDSGVLNFASCFGGYGGSQWCGVSDKYLGVRFKIGVGTHYGWVKLDVNASGSSFTIKEYAYVDTPGVGLTAGQTTLGVDDKTIFNVKVVTLNKSIGLYNIPETSNYSIYDMIGKEVLKGTTHQKDYVIEAPTLTSGIYILELRDTKSDAVMRKKIVLQ